jgi:hypothetical protein
MVLDTMGKVLNIKDFNEYGEVQEKLGPLGEFAEETGLSLLLLHHAGKDQSRNEINSPIGSTAIAGAVDIPALIRREKDFINRISIQGRMGDLNETLRWDPLTHLYELAPESESAGRSGRSAEQTRREAIIAHLNARDGVSDQVQIYGDPNIKGDSDTRRKSLKAMQEEGTITIEKGLGQKRVVKLKPTETGTQTEPILENCSV